MGQEGTAVPEALHFEDAAQTPPPDGGYGWVILGSCFTLNAFTWGVTAVSLVAKSDAWDADTNVQSLSGFIYPST